MDRDFVGQYSTQGFDVTLCAGLMECLHDVRRTFRRCKTRLHIPDVAAGAGCELANRGRFAFENRTYLTQRRVEVVVEQEGSPL